MFSHFLNMQCFTNTRVFFTYGEVYLSYSMPHIPKPLYATTLNNMTSLQSMPPCSSLWEAREEDLVSDDGY